MLYTLEGTSRLWRRNLYTNHNIRNAFVHNIGTSIEYIIIRVYTHTRDWSYTFVPTIYYYTSLSYHLYLLTAIVWKISYPRIVKRLVLIVYHFDRSIGTERERETERQREMFRLQIRALSPISHLCVIILCAYVVYIIIYAYRGTGRVYT